MLKLTRWGHLVQPSANAERGPVMTRETISRLKDKCVDLLLVSMVLISVSGLVYNFFHS